MSRDPYIVFVNAKGNAVFIVTAWIGAILSPLFIMLEFGNFKSFQFYVGIGLALFPILAIRHGIKAMARNNSDFIVYAIVTVLVFMMAVTHMFFYPEVWFGNT